MTRVFVSSRHRSERAARVRETLRLVGYEVVCEVDVQGHTGLVSAGALLAAMESCAVVVAVLDDRHSFGCGLEVGWMLRSGRPVVVVGDCDPFWDPLVERCRPGEHLNHVIDRVVAGAAIDNRSHAHA